MKPLTCIAIDDEPMALLIIAEFCKRKGNITLSTFSEPSIGLKAIRETLPDLVFLDIQMNGMNGLEIAHTLPASCCFIFTTAHANYALEGFNLDAVDFLHKPFSYDRFETAVDKVERRRTEAAESTTLQETIVVKQEYCNVTILVEDILYVEALGNYVKLFRKSGGYVLSHTNMKAIQSLLPDNKFLRIHRSYIVALNKVDRFTRTSIQLVGKTEPLPIGKKYVDIVSEILGRTA